MKRSDINPTKSIPAFFAGQSIFLTGGTGFLGKVFIEKVLRSCHEVHEIFLLIRPKRGISTVERFEKMLCSQLFDRLRKERPSSFEKLIPISGNTSEKGLGLSPADRQMLIERVTIVVHNSASIKFNDTIKDAILSNTRSTRDICVLAESMKNLVALVYVGTTYSQTDCPFVEEKAYPPKVDWRKTIEIVESVDDQVLNVFTAKYLDNMVNTYTFSKNLAEGIIQEYSKSLPCAIVRPSMVVCTIEDPFPGWIDSLNGPLGISLATVTGMAHVMLADEVCQDWIPVDIVIKVLLQAIWKRGITKIMPDSALLVFNSSNGNMKRITIRGNAQISLKITREIPYDNAIWNNGIIITDSFFLFYVLSMFWQILPAFLMDLILKCFNHQPMFFKIQRKLYVANCVLQHFSMNDWIFDNTNTIALNETVPPDNEKDFKFNLNFKQFTYLKRSILGSKQYYLKHDISQAGINAAKAHYRRVTLFTTAFKICVTAWTLWAIYHGKIYSLILLFHLFYSFSDA